MKMNIDTRILWDAKLLKFLDSTQNFDILTKIYFHWNLIAFLWQLLFSMKPTWQLLPVFIDNVNINLKLFFLYYIYIDME